MSETTEIVNYIIVRAPFIMFDVYAKVLNDQNMKLIKNINGYTFYSWYWSEGDVYIMHKSRQAMDELVNMYVLCGGDTTRIASAPEIIQERTKLLIDCAKLLETIK